MSEIALLLLSAEEQAKKIEEEARMPKPEIDHKKSFNSSEIEIERTYSSLKDKKITAIEWWP